MAATGSAAGSRAAPTQGGEEAQWSLKDIYWRGRECKIITQNQNGPCSLIALCNILLLRGELTITPPDRPVVSYSYLSQLIAEHLLSKPLEGAAQGELESALSTLPRTQYGLDVDVGFDSISEFAAAAGDGRQGGAGELALFRLCSVPLVHGWLPDPADSTTYEAVKKAGSYNRATDIVVRGNEVAEGAVVRDRGVGTLAASLASETSVANGKRPERRGWTEEHYAIVRQALALQTFLDNTSTQLTYNGLFVLAQEVAAGEPVALFRNSHLSVLYKRLPNEGLDAADGSGAATPAPPTLFTLATDSSFLLEDEIVWESLVDVDGASSEFYDGKFRKSTLRQGDYVGRDADVLGGAGGLGGEGLHANEDADYALAMQIYQNDQDRIARQQQRRRGRQSQGGYSSRSRPSQQQPAGGVGMGMAALPAPAFETPREVFTTMRYEQEPQQGEAADALVAASLISAGLRAEHQSLLDAMQSLSVGGGAGGQRVDSAVAPAQSTNPFLNASESQTNAISTTTNPFLRGAATEAATPTLAPRHRLFRHIPLLSQHLERLVSSAGAMCRVYSAVWSMAVLEQQGSLQPERILQAIESSLASSAAQDGEGAVKGIRVAIGRDGSIRVTQRTISAFPSMLDSGSNAARPPSVRLDAAPTRVRTMDLEPLVFNKTDARGFYEAAKQRVGADPSVLSGIREGDQRCFDVILWNDEQMDTLDQADAAIPSAPKRLVTESSLANVVVELTGGGAGGSRFITPRTSAGMLDGLLRRWLVDKGVVDEQDIEVDELISWVRQGTAQLWLCNSLRGLWKVELVEGPLSAVPAGAVGSAGAAGTAMGAGAAANEGKKNRFSKLIKGSSRPTNASARTQTGTSSGFEARQSDAVHDQVIDDLYGHRQGGANQSKLQGRKGNKSKDDKNCTVM
ncbi:uncharacterized protein PSANT_06481 [Moesziomyces antarcticus]|nr:uncharacterized protein PSANT_06481 [Moesziomyces antarcticus]